MWATQRAGAESDRFHVPCVHDHQPKRTAQSAHQWRNEHGQDPVMGFELFEGEGEITKSPSCILLRTGLLTIKLTMKLTMVEINVSTKRALA